MVRLSLFEDKAYIFLYYFMEFVHICSNLKQSLLAKIILILPLMLVKLPFCSNKPFLQVFVLSCIIQVRIN